MELSRASERFNVNALDGWDKTGSAWVPAVAAGRFIVFDRFISDRNFGQKKRNFIVGGGSEIPAAYEVVRIADGSVYLLESVNVDLHQDAVGSRIYLFHNATETADIVRLVSGPARSSGAAGDPTPTVVASVHADLERYSALSSELQDDLRLPTYNVYLPGSTDVTLEDVLSIAGQEYTIRELSNQLNLKFLRVTKRGVS